MDWSRNASSAHHQLVLVSDLALQHLDLLSVLILLLLGGLDKFPGLPNLLLEHIDSCLVLLRQSNRSFYARSIVYNCVI